jgi:hypothetical protein
MTRISPQDMARAVGAVRAMDFGEKKALADEVFRVQPNMLASVVVQKKLGVSLEKIDFLLDILLVCFQAMKESGLTWVTVTEDEQERQMQRFAAIVESTSCRDELLHQYVDSHPEKWLVAYVSSELASWLKRIVPEESDKYVMLATWNLVNCIAFAELVGT